MAQKNRKIAYFFGVITILGHNSDSGSNIQKNRREDDFANPLFFSSVFASKIKVRSNFRLLPFSLKVEGIARGLSWIA